MNARRRLVLRIREGHWLAAIGFVLIVCLFGCHPAANAGNDPGPIEPNHCTHVSGSTSTTAPCPTPHTTADRPDPARTQQAAPAVPSNATGFCHDGTYTTLRSPQGKDEQCQGHGGVAEG